jgi:hypothetical protein
VPPSSTPKEPKKRSSARTAMRGHLKRMVGVDLSEVPLGEVMTKCGRGGFDSAAEVGEISPISLLVGLRR